MILNDKQIKQLAEKEEMISPFVSESISKGISHGLGQTKKIALDTLNKW